LDIKLNQQKKNIKLDNVLVIQNLLDDNKEIIDNIIYLQKKIQSYENKVYIKENPNNYIFKIENILIDKLMSNIKKVTNNIKSIKKVKYETIRRKLIFNK
jgi:hypothetical protein